MKSFNSYISEEEKVKSGKKVSVGKSVIKINPNSDELKERADTWHPDPEQDRKLGGPGANQRAREDRESAPKEDPKDPKKLKPGESYMDFAKRHGYKSSPKKEGIVGKLKRKMGLNNSYDYEGEVLESTVPGKPAERLGAVTSIPADEREAAKQRTLAKAAALRKKREEQKEEFEIASFSDFMEARRMDKEGVERGGSDLDKTIRASTKERAAKAVEAVKKGDKRVAKYVKKYGTTPSKDTAERRDLKMMHPGSRQKPKVKGKKETPSETQNRRVNATNTRRAKHGSTAKEKASEKGMSNYENDYKKTYGQHKSAWD